MKKLILLLIPIISFAQPNQLKLVGGKLSNNVYYNIYVTKQGDTVSIANGSVSFPAVQPGQGISLDSNRNLITGLNATVTGNSVGNVITANDAIVENSSNNILHANHIIIRNSNGVTAIGADHVIGDTADHPTGDGANYSNVSGDANTECGYGSSTSGVGNKNFVENGVCEGTLNALGRPGFCNMFHNSSIRGHHNILEGNNSMILGSWIRVFGDNITVIGNAIAGQPQTFTLPGVYIINQQGQVTKASPETENVFRQYTLLLFHMNGQPANEYLIAKPIYQNNK